MFRKVPETKKCILVILVRDHKDPECFIGKLKRTAIRATKKYKNKSQKVLTLETSSQKAK